MSAEARATLAALGDRTYHPAENRGVPYEACEDILKRFRNYVSSDSTARVIRRAWFRRHCGQRMIVIHTYGTSCACGHGRYVDSRYVVCACSKCNKGHRV